MSTSHCYSTMSKHGIPYIKSTLKCGPCIIGKIPTRTDKVGPFSQVKIENINGVIKTTAQGQESLGDMLSFR